MMIPIIEDFILKKGDVFIIKGTSIASGFTVGSPIVFGSIAKIYETSDLYQVGENVAFDPTGSKEIGYSGYVFTLVKEENILYSEGMPPA